MEERWVLVPGRVAGGVYVLCRMGAPDPGKCPHGGTPGRSCTYFQPLGQLRTGAVRQSRVGKAKSILCWEAGSRRLDGGVRRTRGAQSSWVEKAEEGRQHGG